MTGTDSPIAVLMCIVLLVAFVGVRPFLKTKRLNITPPKLIALAIVVGYCVVRTSLIPALILLWPLSFIHFPDYWANFRGFIHGPHIDQPSPPILVTVFGWLFFVAGIFAIHWIGM